MARKQTDTDKPKRGRPTAKLPPEVIAALGDGPPADPLEAAAWVNRLMLQVLWLECRGLIPETLSQRLRATSGAFIRSIPDAIKAALDERIKASIAGEDTEGAGGQAPEPIAPPTVPTVRG